MPENFGSVFDSKMSASLQLRNDSEADTANASVMEKAPLEIFSGGAISLCESVFVRFGRAVILALAVSQRNFSDAFNFQAGDT